MTTARGQRRTSLAFPVAPYNAESIGNAVSILVLRHCFRGIHEDAELAVLLGNSVGLGVPCLVSSEIEDVGQHESTQAWWRRVNGQPVSGLLLELPNKLVSRDHHRNRPQGILEIPTDSVARQSARPCHDSGPRT